MLKNTDLDYISPHTRKSILTSTNPTIHLLDLHRNVFRPNHKCTGVHIFGDAKMFCPNLILVSQITYKQKVLMLRLKRTISNKSSFLNA